VKRASYRDAVDFIAQNDEPYELDEDVVSGLASVVLVASIFGVESERVARDVVRLRKRIAKEEGQ
jgi:hypothetical protein